MHKCSYRVYYEDTDAGQVVYYANYLKFAERARTEMLRERGVCQLELRQQEGILFVVKEVQMQLHKPARLDDMLTILTTVKKLGRASILLNQDIHCMDLLLAQIEVVVVSINQHFKPTSIPISVKERL